MFTARVAGAVTPGLRSRTRVALCESDFTGLMDANVASPAALTPRDAVVFAHSAGAVPVFLALQARQIAARALVLLEPGLYDVVQLNDLVDVRCRELTRVNFCGFFVLRGEPATSIAQARYGIRDSLEDLNGERMTVVNTKSQAPVPGSERSTVAGGTRRRTFVRATRPTSLLFSGAGLLAFSLLLGVLIMLGEGSPVFQPIDDAWRRLVWIGPHGDDLVIARVFQEVGQARTGTILSSIVVVTLIVLGRWRTAIACLLVSAVAGIFCGFIIKQIVGRPRPVEAGELLAPAAGGIGSYPSSHTATVVSLLIMILIATSGRTRIVAGSVFGVAALGMTWQRTMVQEHFLSDTVGAAAFTTGVGFLVWWVLWNWLSVERGLPLQRWTRTTPKA